MPEQTITSNISLPSAIQIDTATFLGALVTSSLRVTGSIGAASFGSNITVTGAGSFRVATPGIVTLAVGTVALSSDLSTQADLPSNSIRFVAVGTVLQVYFNQTASVILRGVVNLGTF